MAARRLQHQSRWHVVTFVTAVAVLLSMRESQASCGDYLHRKSVSLVTSVGFSDAELPVSSWQVQSAGTDLRPWAGVGPTAEELLRTTECRGPHCQKAPTGNPNPVQLISVPRDTQDVLGSLSAGLAEGLRDGLMLSQLGRQQPSRGYPLPLEIPPECLEQS